MAALASWPPTEAGSVADAVTPFDSHECRSEKSDQLFLSAGIREHLRLGQGEGAASFHHAPTGKDALACGGSEKVDLELGGENPSVSRHESKRSNPAALSAMAVTDPAWTNPCCCEIAGWGLSAISTMPGETLLRVAPNVVISPCLAKLDRTRSCCFSGVILLVLLECAHIGGHLAE